MSCEAPAACPAPTTLTSANITGTSADINWTEIGSATTWDIFVSTVNTAPTAGTTPTYNDVTTKPYNITGLSGLTTYYVWVRSDCGGSGTSTWTGSINFTTPCAGTPTGGTTNASANPVCPGTSFTLSLTGNTTGSGITYQWQSSPDNSTWTNISGATGASFVVSSGISASTWYRCVITCSGNNSNSTALQVNTTVSVTPYCLPVYTTGCGSSDVITRVKTGTLDNATGCSACAVGNFTTGQPVPDFQQSTNASVSVTVGTGGTEHVRIFIDFNQDNDFLDAGENVLLGSGNGVTITGNVPIPATATLGNTRMRVRLVYNTSAFTECSSHTYGESEDYTVNITAAPTCFPPSSLTVTNITGSAADLSWTAPSPAPSGGYEWAVTTSITPPASGASTSSTTASASSLTGQTIYYLHVRSNCDGNGFSSWATSSAFTTLLDCASGTVLTCGTSTTSGNLATSGSTISVSACGFSTLGKEKVYLFTPTVTGNHTLNITSVNGGSGFIDYFYKDAAGGCGATGWTCINDLDVTGTTSFGPLTAGITYYILLDAEATTGTANHTFKIDCPSPITYVSSTVTQASALSVSAGSTGNAILRIEVTVIGTANSLSVTQLDLSTAGTTAAGTDIANAKVYYTGTSATFSTTTQFGTTSVGPNGAFVVTGAQNLTGGASNTVNYFWLAYDINCTATPTNVVDGQCTAFTIGGTPQTPAVTDPAGNRAISALYAPSYASVGTSSVEQGSTANQMVRINISGSSICAGTATSITFNTSTSTNPASDIKNARCFYTTNTTFSSATPFGSAVANPSGNITFSGTQVLASGIGNYFWLVYDMECTANSANSVNATAISLVVQGLTWSVTGSTPTAKTITLLASATTAAAGNWSNAATWTSGCVPNNESTTLTLAHDVTLDGMFQAGSITLNSTRTLSIPSGTSLTMGPAGGGNRILTANGTLSISGGTLNLNGSVAFGSSSTFNLNTGVFNLDPNNGVSGTSAAANTIAFTSANINATSGNINLLDPPFSSTNLSVSYSVTSTDAVLGTGCIVTIGGGTHQNASNTNGFLLDGNVGTGTLEFGTVVINGGRYSARRHASTATSAADNLKIRNLTVNTGAELVVQGSVLGIVGAVLQNDGFITVTSVTANRGIAFCGDVQYTTGVLFSNSTTAQQITGAGFFKKAVTDTDPASSNENVVNSLAIFHNNNSGGLSLTAPLSVINLDLGAGIINSSVSAPLTIGFGPTSITPGTVFTGGAAAGSSPTSVTLPLTAAWPGAWVNGPVRRWYTSTTVGQQALLPMGSSLDPQLGSISFTTAPTTAGMLEGTYYASSAAGGTDIDPALTQSGIANPITNLSPTGYWDILPTTTNGAAGSPLTYTALFYANGFSKEDGITQIESSNYANLVLLKRPSTSTSATDWALNGAHVTSAQAGSWTGVVRLSRTGMTGFSHFALGGTALALPLELLSFTGETVVNANLLKWETGTEKNVQWHILERSVNGASWQELTRLAGQIQSSQRQAYQFLDESPLPFAYYRVRSVDYDGKTQISNVIALRRTQELFGFTNIYPTPTSGPLTIQFYSALERSVSLQVTGITGRLEIQQALDAVPGINEKSLDISQLPSGMYHITLSDGHQVSKPMVIVKE